MQQSEEDFPIPAVSSAFAAVAARESYPVLLRGETGVGKSTIAELIHRSSPRRGRPFIIVDCASIAPTLFEREMFGHVRGAFTDARESCVGFIEAAHLGSLFLDEIGELTSSLQSKLLAVLDRGRIRRLGGTAEIAVDVRILVATHRDVDALIAAGQFREDLFHRCAVLEHTVPPLRERSPREFARIATRLLQSAAPAGSSIHPDAMVLLRTHSWPGNVRELDNTLRRILAHTQCVEINGNDVRAHIRIVTRELTGDHETDGELRGIKRHGKTPRNRYSGRLNIAEERMDISRALLEEVGNKAAAARRLGMSRTTLWAKMLRHGLTAAALASAQESTPRSVVVDQ